MTAALAINTELAAQRDVAQADLERALTCLAQLVKQLDRESRYATHGEQAEVRIAKALLVECGR